MTNTTPKINAWTQLTNDGQYPVDQMTTEDLDHEALRETGWTLHEPTEGPKDYYEHDSGLRLIIRYDPTFDWQTEYEVPRLKNGPYAVYDDEVVWGIADTEDEAIRDAAGWLPDENGQTGVDPDMVREQVEDRDDALSIRECSCELARRVLGGEADLARETDEHDRLVPVLEA